TAQCVMESTQMLADSNRIVHKSIASLARDSQGRVRREQSLPGTSPASVGDGPSVVFITDPVAGVAYVLDSRSRSARKIAVTRPETITAQAESKTTTPTATSDTLGMQFIEGLEAQRTRTTRTLRVGEAGNER